MFSSSMVAHAASFSLNPLPTHRNTTAADLLVRSLAHESEKIKFIIIRYPLRNSPSRVCTLHSKN